jgi:hypothetical protein
LSVGFNHPYGARQFIPTESISPFSILVPERETSETFRWNQHLFSNGRQRIVRWLIWLRCSKAVIHDYWGERPIADARFSGDTLGMNNQTWLVEVAFLACVAAVATIAFTLMVGNAIWKRMAGESPP